jgi:hypothetical protein
LHLTATPPATYRQAASRSETMRARTRLNTPSPRAFFFDGVQASQGNGADN